MTCEEVTELMQRHLDGDLNNEELQRMTEHLEGCPDCAEMMERLERLDRDLANLPKVTPAYSLVDAILPRLAQIDAAKESTPALEALPPRLSEGRARRPWYARGAFVRYGGLAAAAAVLGVLVVNGLTDSFQDNASTAQESAASEGAMAETMMAADSAAPASEEPAADDASAKRNVETPAEGSPAAGEAPAAPAAPAPDAPVSSSEESAPAPEPRAETPAKGEGVGIMEAPIEPPSDAASEPQPAEGEAEGSAGAGAMGFEGAEPEEAPEENAAVPPVEADRPRYGITGDPAVQDDGPKEKGATENSAAPALLSEDGTYSAAVERMQDGTLVVVVNQLEGEADYASVHRWAADATTVELVGWEGATLTYTASDEQGTRTFRIDAAAATETEIEPDLE